MLANTISPSSPSIGLGTTNDSHGIALLLQHIAMYGNVLNDEGIEEN